MAIGAPVNLVVSSGPSVTVPDVVGLVESGAASVITSVGLTLGTVSSQFSSTVAEGVVIATSPATDTEVLSGSTVD